MLDLGARCSATRRRILWKCHQWLPPCRNGPSRIMGKVWENWPDKGKQHGDLASVFQLIEPLDCWKGIEIRIRIIINLENHMICLMAKIALVSCFNAVALRDVVVLYTIYYIYEITQPYIYILCIYYICMCIYIYILICTSTHIVYVGKP